jgi:hypothetical protein
MRSKTVKTSSAYFLINLINPSGFLNSGAKLHKVPLQIRKCQYDNNKIIPTIRKLNAPDSHIRSYLSTNY